MKTNISKTIIQALLAILAPAGSILAHPDIAPSSGPVMTLGSTKTVPDASAAEIPVPVQFARFGAFPHPGAAFAPFETIRSVPLGEPFTFRTGDRF